jgi:hypothetical protein
VRRRGRIAAAPALVLVSALALAGWAGAPRAGAAGIDGVSDQSLPAWEGSFPASRLAAAFGDVLAGPTAQIRYARYVLQWNALQEPSGGPAAAGDYRERFEAWLGDVGLLRLTPVLALTSFDGVRPATPARYAASLRALLDRAAALGVPVPYVEAWNEPNDQGREPAAAAAALADAAQAVCEGGRRCTVIAGDFEDRRSLPGYERAYEQALAFRPLVWGLHPYGSLLLRSDARLRAFRAALPDGGRGVQVWFTEAAAFYCRRGAVLGQDAQVREAAYLVGRLLGDPALPVAHAFYYGVMFKDGLPAPCAAGGGEDSELYGPDGQPRTAAGIVFAAGAGGRAPLLGPSPGEDPLAFRWLGGGSTS